MTKGRNCGCTLHGRGSPHLNRGSSMESGSTLAWLMMSLCKFLWITLLDDIMAFNDLLPLSFRIIISPIALECAVISCGRNTPPCPTDSRLGHSIWFGQHHVWPMPHPNRSFKSHGLSSLSLDVKMTFHVCWVASVMSDSTAMDCSLPGSSVHGIFQGWILEWVVMPTPGDLPDPWNGPVSLLPPKLAGRFLNH